MAEAIYQRIERASKLSIEGLADELFSLVENPVVSDIEKNMDPASEVIRVLASRNFEPLKARIRSALAYGARTWSMTSNNSTSYFIAASLFKGFSSPEIAIALTQRLLGTSSHSPAFSVSSPYSDLLVEAVLNEAGDMTVRSRVMDLIFDDRFSEYTMTIFYRLARVDVTCLPMFIDKVFSRVAQFEFINDRPTYIVGFDTKLNLADIQNIMNQLTGEQLVNFNRLFLGYSTRFKLIQGVIAEAAVDASSMDFRDGALATMSLEDEKLGGNTKIYPEHAGAVMRGFIANFLANRKLFISELVLLGLKEKPMFAEGT
jgi:hypothetical protein